MADALEVSGAVLEVLVGGPPLAVRGALLEVLCGGPSLDPVDSALEAVALHFRQIPGIATSLRAYPEHGIRLDISQGPAVTVTYVTHQREAVSPAPDPSDDRLWVTHDLLITAQLDLWGDYRYSRDLAARALEDALHNRLETHFQEGLYLNSSGYHGRSLVVEASEGHNTDEPDAATEGEWRRTWMLTVQSDLVRRVDLPRQDTITLRPRVQSAGRTDTDDDIDIT